MFSLHLWYTKKREGTKTDYNKINKSQKNTERGRNKELKKSENNEQNSNRRSLPIDNYFKFKWIKFPNQMILESVSILLIVCPALP